LTLSPSTDSLDHSLRPAPKPSKRAQSSSTGDHEGILPELEAADEIEAASSDACADSIRVNHEESDGDARVAQIESLLDDGLAASIFHDSFSEPDLHSVTEEDSDALVEIFADGTRHVIGDGEDPDDGMSPAMNVLFF
jgi:hypothetical protein